MTTASLLHGTRIIDLSQYIPGPYASLMLADLGADVVKVEPPVGDPMRQYGANGAEVSSLYSTMNGGKRVVHLDLKAKKDHTAILDLLASADVLIESYRPGVMDRLGLSRKVLESSNSRLVHCSISSYGSNGPLAGKAAHDINCMALGGGLALSGTVARPVITTPPVADYASALQAGLTILSALLSRQKTGKGCYIDISMTDTVLAWQSCFLVDALRGGSIAKRGIGESSGGLASYNIYETADGRFITIGADEDKFWERFCLAVGRPDWVSRKAEPAPQTDLIGQVQKLVRSKTLADWNALLQYVDCCFQPVLEPSEIAKHPQFVSRGVVAAADRPEGGVEILYPAWIDGRPPQPRVGYRDVSIETVLQSWASVQPAK